MSLSKVSESFSLEKKPDIELLDPLLEVNENAVSDEFMDRPIEVFEMEEIPPKIFTFKDIKEPLTCESLNNAIYEMGVISLCWPEIEEPTFETRTCFPKSYYTNNNKERLLLSYAENFRQQFNYYYKRRSPLLLQVPNECGLQKMVCTSIRPTKICYPGTNTWHGVAELVADYFDYEPLHKPMLHACAENFKELDSDEELVLNPGDHRPESSQKAIVLPLTALTKQTQNNLRVKRQMTGCTNQGKERSTTLQIMYEPGLLISSPNSPGIKHAKRGHTWKSEPGPSDFCALCPRRKSRCSKNSVFCS